MVWLRPVDHLDDLRDPAALPGWLSRGRCLARLRVPDASIRGRALA
jgi:hypothetical protein